MPFKDKQKTKNASNKHYEANKDEIKSRSYQRRYARKEWYQGLLDTLSCVSCGEDTNETLDFHHLDPSEKEGQVGRLLHNLAPMKKVMEEIEKCTTLCANCHRKHHAGKLNLTLTEDHKTTIPKRLQIW